MIKRRNVISWDGGSGYRTYIFKESTRYYVIDCKGWEYKEVIYLYIADVSCTQSVYKSTGLSYRGPYSGVPWHLLTIIYLINHLVILRIYTVKSLVKGLNSLG